MKYSSYFTYRHQKPDRTWIKQEWIEYVFNHPESEYVQADRRIRRWAAIGEADGRYLRIVVLEDGETVHNAFFDRSYRSNL